MENTDAPAADHTLISESLQMEISRALEILNERERDIIEMSFGISQPEMTLEEIGDRFGLTRERVRQIREKAIRKLRNANKTGILRSYLG
jgi:RNA polymerase primary sigma factor